MKGFTCSSGLSARSDRMALTPLGGRLPDCAGGDWHQGGEAFAVAIPCDRGPLVRYVRQRNHDSSLGAHHTPGWIVQSRGQRQQVVPQELARAAIHKSV